MEKAKISRLPHQLFVYLVPCIEDKRETKISKYIGVMGSILNKEAQDSTSVLNRIQRIYLSLFLVELFTLALGLLARSRDC